MKRIVLCAAMAVTMRAATLIDVSGPNDATTSFSSLGNNLAVGFTLGASYTNVEVIAHLWAPSVNSSSESWNLTAYMTNQIGAGTTVANEVASRFEIISIPADPFPLDPPYTISPLSVFSGLSLGPGNYFMILSGSFVSTNMSWVGSSPPSNLTISTAPGTSVILGAGTAGAPDPYLPASIFSENSTNFGLWFQVNGDPVSDVPEPAAGVFIAAGLIVLRLTPRRK